jgi:hypothetical protein
VVDNAIRFASNHQAKEGEEEEQPATRNQVF